MSSLASRVLGWKHISEAAAVLASFILYLVGIKFLFLPVVIWLNARYVPMPKVFSSWFSRLVVGFMFAAVLLQIASAVQFVLFPQSNFVVLALILVLLEAIVWKFVPVQPAATWKELHLFGAKDAAAAAAALFFLLPFVPMLLGSNAVLSISKIGGIQAIDATNHYVTITQMMHEQHLDYSYGHYYPKGFHIAVGFIENTVFESQYNLGWRGNVIVFFAQYIASGVLLAYLTFYFALSLLNSLLRKLVSVKLQWLLALTIGPALAFFYLIPFVPEGFLNYYYVIATILVGVTVLTDLNERYLQSNQEKRSILDDPQSRWPIISYFVLIFGASVSWPLLTPILMIVGLWFVIPTRLISKRFLGTVLSGKGFPLIVVLLLQLVPIYFQLKYTADSSQGINATGGLRQFHAYIILAGFVLMMGALLSKKVHDSYKKLLLNIYAPLGLFIVLLVVMQLFTTGEVRYYAIKSGMLLEVMLLVLGVVLLLSAVNGLKKYDLKYVVMLPVVPLALMLLLVSSIANPLKDLRDLFRDYSHQEKPAFFDHDLGVYDRLGINGTIKHYNSTILHYNAEQGKFAAHMQASYWANMMSYDDSPSDFKALLCNSTLYSNLAFGTFTAPEQKALIEQVKECAQMAHDRGETYYIVTDQGSLDMMHQTFGGIATYVY